MSVLRCLRIFQNEFWCYQEQKTGSDETITWIKWPLCPKSKVTTSLHQSSPLRSRRTDANNKHILLQQAASHFPMERNSGFGRAFGSLICADGSRLLSTRRGRINEGEGYGEMRAFKKTKKQNPGETWNTWKNHSVHGEKHHGKWGNQTGSMGFIVDSKCLICLEEQTGGDTK